ncbi:hypothetical protein GW931_02645 [archaeon]|nr:hypothetical protein [archaeon]
MKKEIENILNELTESKELENFGIDKASLEKMITYGKKLFPFPKDEKKERNLVTKCMSTVYLIGNKKEGKMNYLATSDSAFVKSELYFILTFFNELAPEEILSENVKKEYNQFFSELQKLVPMSMNRQQGFEGAYERIIEIAKDNL